MKNGFMNERHGEMNDSGPAQGKLHKKARN